MNFQKFFKVSFKKINTFVLRNTESLNPISSLKHKIKTFNDILLS